MEDINTITLSSPAFFSQIIAFRLLYLRAVGENPSRATTVSSEKSKYVHVMCRPLTISTEIKLAAAFWAGFGRSKIILLA